MIFDCLRTDFYQVYAMMWKNLKVQTRQKKFCCCQIFLPLVLLFIVFLADLAISDITEKTKLDGVDVNFGNASQPVDLEFIQNYARALNFSTIPSKVLYSVTDPTKRLNEDIVEDYDSEINPNDFVNMHSEKYQDEYIYEMFEAMDSLKYDPNTLAIGGLTFDSLSEYTVQYEASQAPAEPEEMKGDVQFPYFAKPSNFCELAFGVMKSEQCESLFVVSLMNYANLVLFNRSIRTKVAQTPYSEDDGNSFTQRQEVQQFIGFIYPLILLFPLPVYLFTLVMEKQKRIKELLKLMGLKERNYQVSNYISFLLHYVLINCIIFYFWGYVFRHRVLTQTNFFLIVLVFFGCGCSTISLAFFLSAFIDKMILGTVIGCFVMLFSSLMSVFTRFIMNEGVLYMKPMLVISPFPVVDVINSMVIRCSRLACPDVNTLFESRSFMISVMMLYVNAIFYFLMYLYFNQVVSKSVGRSKHPLFFLKPFYSCLCYCVCCSSDDDDDNPKNKQKKKKNCYEENEHVDDSVKELIQKIDEGEVIHKNNRMILSKGLVKKYGKHHALKQLYFEVKPNEAYGLLGMNGAGKSTCMRIMTGFHHPDSDPKTTMYVNGKSIDDLESIRENVGFVPQFSILYDCLTAKEHLDFLYLFQGKPVTSDNEDFDNEEEEEDYEENNDNNKKKKKEECQFIYASVLDYVLGFISGLIFSPKKVKQLLQKVDLYEPRPKFYSSLKSCLQFFCCCFGCFIRHQKLVSEMSGGMKRRLSIAISFIGDPKVLVLDEPTTGLDPLSKRKIWNLLIEAKKKKTILISSHSMEEVETLCDRIGMMNEGRLICYGDLLDLKDRYADGYNCKIRFTSQSKQQQEQQQEENSVEVGKAWLGGLGYCEVELLHEFESLLQFDLRPLEGFKISRLFKDMEKAKSMGILVDWEINRTSMDVVFLNVLAKDQKYLFSLKKKRNNSTEDLVSRKKNWKSQSLKEEERMMSKVNSNDEEDVMELEEIKYESEEEEENKSSSTETDDSSEDEDISKRSEEEEGEEEKSDDIPIIEQKDQDVIINEVHHDEEEEEDIIEKESSDEESDEEEQQKEDDSSSSSHSSTTSLSDDSKPLESGEYPNYEEEKSEFFQKIGSSIISFVLPKLIKFMNCCCFCLCLGDHFTQYLVLTKKNLLLYRSSWKFCCFLFLLPFVMCFLTFIFYIMVVSSYDDNFYQHPQEFEPINGMSTKCVSWNNQKCYHFVYTTNGSPFAKQVMGKIFNSDDFEENEDDMEYLEVSSGHQLFEFQMDHRNSSLIQIEFPSSFSSDNLEYIMYFNHTSFVDGMRPDVANVIPYWKNLIDSSVMSVIGNVKNVEDVLPKLSLKRFPKIPEEDVTFLKGLLMAEILPGMFMIMLSFFLVSFLSRLVTEKESLQYHNMRIMGLSDFSYLCSYYTLFTVFNMIISLLVILGCYIVQVDAILYCDFIIIYLLFFLFTQAMVSYPFIFWRFVKSRKTGVLLGFLFCVMFIITGMGLVSGAGMVLQYHEDQNPLIPFLLHLIFPAASFQKAFVEVSYIVSPVFDREKNEYVREDNFGWDDFGRPMEFREADKRPGRPGHRVNNIAFFWSYLYLVYHILFGMVVIFIVQRIKVSRCLFPRDSCVYYLDCCLNCVSGVCQKTKNLVTYIKRFIWKNIIYRNDPFYNDPLDSLSKEDDFKADDFKQRMELIQKTDLEEEKELASKKDYFFRIKGLKKFFFSSGRLVRAVDGLNLACRERVCLSILGHNGAGKSTTLGCATTVHKATSGSIYINNQKVGAGNSSVTRRLLGVCNQYDILYDDLTPIQHLVLFLGIKRRMSLSDFLFNCHPIMNFFGCCCWVRCHSEWYKEVKELLSSLSLLHVRNKKIKTFSGGMKRRLSVAISLIGKPKLVVLDEPTTGMDPYSRSEVWDLIHELKKSKTILLTSHSMEEVSALATKITILKKGKLKCVGTALSLKAKYGTGYNLKIIVESRKKKKMNRTRNMEDEPEHQHEQQQQQEEEINEEDDLQIIDLTEGENIEEDVSEEIRSDDDHSHEEEGDEIKKKEEEDEDDDEDWEKEDHELLEIRKEMIKKCVLEECGDNNDDGDGVRIVADNGANLLFSIKFDRIDGLIRVLQWIENEENSDMVRNFGVGQCTLEDVYLSITGDKEEEKEEDDEDKEKDEKDSENESEEEEEEIESSEESEDDQEEEESEGQDDDDESGDSDSSSN